VEEQADRLVRAQRGVTAAASTDGAARQPGTVERGARRVLVHAPEEALLQKMLLIIIAIT
jgi:hypothetical protein